MKYLLLLTPFLFISCSTDNTPGNTLNTTPRTTMTGSTPESTIRDVQSPSGVITPVNTGTIQVQ